MSAAAGVLTTLHLILQVGFISVTMLLLFVTILNRMRVRRVLLSWLTGRLLGLPLWPAVFLGAVLLFLGGALAVGHAVSLKLVIGYLFGGCFWLASTLLSTSVLVTEYGLICHPHRARHAVAWGQVVDYFETKAGRKHHYVFFYLDPAETRCRLELTVPRSRRALFNRVVTEKLDARFDFSVRQGFGKKALEG